MATKTRRTKWVFAILGGLALVCWGVSTSAAQEMIPLTLDTVDTQGRHLDGQLWSPSLGGYTSAPAQLDIADGVPSRSKERMVVLPAQPFG